jgi:PepSY-associated transmembrane protein
MSPRLFLLRLLRRWHARIGFAAMLFFLILAVTGLVLNHGNGLGLDGRFIHAGWLARWYGIKFEPPRQAFRSGHHVLIAANGCWLLDGKISGEKLPQPVGLIELADIFVVASDTVLHVYRNDGELIDKLGRSALPGVPVRAIGSSARRIVLRIASGTFSSQDGLSWRTARQGNVHWSTPAELSAAERQAYENALAPGISVQQLLLDLHSGRFAGRYGPWVVDLLALMLAILSLSGAWLFLVPRHRGGWH